MFRRVGDSSRSRLWRRVFSPATSTTTPCGYTRLLAGASGTTALGNVNWFQFN